MTVELALKGALVALGAAANEFKGPQGHDLKRLSHRLARESRYTEDNLLFNFIGTLPPYVESRYIPSGFTRLYVVRLALGAQFSAATSVRRFLPSSLASEMAADSWPGPRAVP
ncbi:hypothetical protein [Pinirhizobacter sp.]|jgi:hypothetical protein|uniref:hypothetical protein n=1 Tax=Pinirhizobacter sp. TaxID=2950432 RepID=UPI002F3E9B61